MAADWLGEEDEQEREKERRALIAAGWIEECDNDERRALVAARIFNWAAWRRSGYVGPTGGKSPMAWLDQLITRKPAASGMPVMNGRAMDTHEVLGRMEHALRDVLVWYYLGTGGTVQLRFESFNAERDEQLRISMRTFQRQVSQAHVQFIDRLRDYLALVQAVGRSNALAAAAARPVDPPEWPALPVKQKPADPAD